MSANKSIKFEISLEKLTVKFEGDIQTAQLIQNEVTGALNTLASTQTRMLGPGKPPVAPTVVEVKSRRRGRRRAGGATPPGIDPAILDAEVAAGGNGDTPEAAAPRARRTGSGQSVLIEGIKQDGFFSEKRTISEIREALARKGHTFQSNEVSPCLVSLTKKGTLKREKSADGQWLYYAE